MTCRILTVWRSTGVHAAAAALDQVDSRQMRQSVLLQELRYRLDGAPGPRLLVDGVWFVHPHGGISRVWEQILRCWALPGLVGQAAPVLVVDRDSHLAAIDPFPQLAGDVFDPLDWSRLAQCSETNRALVGQAEADVFVSSWITSTGGERASIPELALVHDCIPERYSGLDPALRQLRNRWLLGAASHLAVSAATARDLSQALASDVASIPWCHPCTVHCFSAEPTRRDLWPALQSRLQLPEPFVLLPASSSIGSYKNPELVLEALSADSLQSVQLLLSGVAALKHAQRYRECFPRLAARIHVHSLNDLELQLLYRHALAVVVPSRREGFGLPVLEALASGGRVLTMDVDGLREAASGAVPCLDPEDPTLLRRWLELFLDPASRSWLAPHLARRRQARLAGLNSDLLGLTLLAEARRLATRQSR
ncbi:hypothetical protein SynPROSU1_00145 [Synechococcus sp. PROS-U-1]|nr:hypothetical protein SynPROSU1_00145 [Synechococcus sp. PROS-U-1]